MKLKIIDGQMHLIAENQVEAVALVAMSQQGSVEEKHETPHFPKKKYKQQRWRTCTIAGCSQRVKGALGLARHISLSHKRAKKAKVTFGAKKFACDFPNCDAQYGRSASLGLHKRHVHGVRSLRAGYNRAWYLKRKSKVYQGEKVGATL